MKNIIIILAFGAVVIGGAFLVWKAPQLWHFGAQMNVASSYFGATSAAFTCPSTATTTDPVLTLDNTRTNAIISNRSAQPMFIHVKAEATTTGVVVNSGIYLSPDGFTTSTETRIELQGAKGYVYCISPVAASGTVYSVK